MPRLNGGLNSRVCVQYYVIKLQYFIYIFYKPWKPSENSPLVLARLGAGGYLRLIRHPLPLSL